ncbi:TetR/AcrR family transcriptional regulator [Loigolactobacillus backii]|uniref:TetR/AcrR family transcriptional regulator n=1 Tax=Loigolactobacillus backii TaxID=375175 RepID=UPI0022FD4BAF|nr:TetR/AcrR family transcriptional regulator [Loigolactobacillus backii]MDA5388222.1 TetR/AcrR family transcriptional regulator [Loigolactobacillus backii]MDA5390675.1 TetR/AcrR family transcriptional regulator [Loigolactobacillus backii]
MTQTKEAIPKDPAKIQRIMESALHIFAQKGYRGAKTESIARVAEVSKGIVFRYYGNKEQLYLATLEFALKRVMDAADYSVWTSAADLTDMVVKATRYKIQLQLQFPDEFELSMSAYAPSDDLPTAMKTKIAKMYTQKTSAAIDLLLEPVLKRLNLRPGITIEDIQHMMDMVVTAIGQESSAFMKKHPHATIAEFDEIIDHAKRYLDILQNGFIAK